jgi:microsomal epoxide hydrolase
MQPPLEPWSTGTSVAYMQRLIGYWRNGFDWRAKEAMLNRFRQFTVPLAGIDVHFIHEHGKGPDPMPLLLSHGWPGSVVEFHKLIPMLTDPARCGADPADAFTVVAPSLPGYTLSFRPGQKRFSVEEIAEVFAELMTDVLGYQRFGAQGGDWGAFVTSRLGYQFAQRLTGIHLNMLAVRSGRKMLETTEEKLFLAQLDEWLKDETGYQWIQGTRPTTLAFGLTDSPVGLAAWIVEKFRAWTDNSGEPDSAVSMDEMLTNITLYWVTGAIGSSFWPYYALRHGIWPIPEGAPKSPCRQAMSSSRTRSCARLARLRSAFTPISNGGLSCLKAATSPHLSSLRPLCGRSGSSSNHCGAMTEDGRQKTEDGGRTRRG